MKTKHLKVRIAWEDFALFPEDDWNETEERSLVTEHYHPREVVLSSSFEDLITSLEMKYDIRLERKKDSCFLQLRMEAFGNDAEDLAKSILEELEQHLET